MTSTTQSPSAIEDLYDRRILHGDISTANIMIAVNGSGRLIDLDLAWDRDEVGARLSVRAVSSQPQFILGFGPADLPALQGTWQFMSTRLLTVPGKVHELCDDLESLWFVFLYEALHFVKHNEPPGIDMHTIFDHINICQKTGAHTGGLGKRDLYSFGQRVVANIAFTSQPFTTLIGEMYLLFKTLSKHYEKQDDAMLWQDDIAQDDIEQEYTIVKNVPKLKDCAEIKRLFKKALDSKEWSETCDKVEDQYPPNEHLTPKEKNTVALSHLKHALGRSPYSNEPSGTKRKREEDKDESEGDLLGIPPSPQNKKPNTNRPLRKGALGRLSQD